MKKYLFAFIVLCSILVSSQLFAQVGHKSEVGIYIGPNFSHIDINSPQLTADSRSGYQAGFFVRGGKLIYGQAGLQYQLYKSDFLMPDSTGEVNDVVAFRRLQLPLYGGVNLMPVMKGVFNIRAYAGPVVSYDISVSDNDLHFTPSDFNRFRIDGTIGAGVDVLIFSLDAGYTMGINDLFQGNLEGRGNYAFVNLGLKF